MEVRTTEADTIVVAVEAPDARRRSRFSIFTRGDSPASPFYDVSFYYNVMGDIQLNIALVGEIERKGCEFPGDAAWEPSSNDLVGEDLTQK